MWSLRSLADENFTLISENQGGSVQFDRSGRYVAIGTSSLELFDVKTAKQFAKFGLGKERLTGIRYVKWIFQ